MKLDEARAADAADPLAGFRARFRLPAGTIYLDGNSLGALPAATPARMADVIGREWGTDLIRSWNDSRWIDAPRRVGAKIARLIGADADEVVVADSTSVALFKLAVAAARSRPDATAVLVEAGNFPTDAHIGQGVADLLGLTLRTVPAEGLAAALTGDVAVALLAHVNYRGGARHDIAALERMAALSDVPIVWDLSHSVGAIPLDLGGAGARLAVGCGYKYLNGGPGAPAFLHVARDLHDRLRQPLTGWMGHATPFAFADAHAPAAGIAAFLTGTPPMLGLLALEVGVDLMAEADPAAIAAKSAALFDLLADRVAAEAPELVLASSRDPARRGSHIAFAHPHAYEIVQALIARGVIGDYREPGLARFGLTPLYLSYEDIWRAGEIIATVMREGAWRDPRFAVRGRVT